VLAARSVLYHECRLYLAVFVSSRVFPPPFWIFFSLAPSVRNIWSYYFLFVEGTMPKDRERDALIRRGGITNNKQALNKKK
jgi:hypothetical protein